MTMNITAEAVGELTVAGMEAIYATLERSTCMNVALSMIRKSLPDWLSDQAKQGKLIPSLKLLTETGHDMLEQREVVSDPVLHRNVMVAYGALSAMTAISAT